MNPVLRRSLQAILLLAILFAFLVVTPSLLGLVYSTVVVFSVLEILAYRRDQAARAFNAAVRAVSHRDAALPLVANAFASRGGGGGGGGGGPLAASCYEFTRRLTQGQPAVHAAIDAGVPLELATAIALQTKAPGTPAASRLRDDEDEDHSGDRWEGEFEFASPFSARMLYLSLVGLAAFSVCLFTASRTLPTLQKIADVTSTDIGEFTVMLITAGSAAPWLAVFLLSIGVVRLVARRGHLFGSRLPAWTMTSLPVARRRSQVLHGLADATELGWPLKNSLRLARDISTDATDRRELETAIHAIDSGVNSATALFRGGLIDEVQYAWLAKATPARAAQLLRAAADDLVRSAVYNGTWYVNLIYPLAVLLAGAVVLMFGYGMFGAVMRLCNA